MDKNNKVIDVESFRIASEYTEAKNLLAEKALVQKRLRAIDKRLRELRLVAAAATDLARTDLDHEAQRPLFPEQESFPSLHK